MKEKSAKHLHMRRKHARGIPRALSSLILIGWARMSKSSALFFESSYGFLSDSAIEVSRNLSEIQYLIS